MQTALFVVLIASCVWLAIAESLVSAIAFFAFGLIVLGALSFMLCLGGAVGGFVDQFIRRFGRRH